MEPNQAILVDAKRILIVEDNQVQSQILQQMLLAAGFQVDVVTNGLAAVEIAQDEQYDVLLVDYKIPEIDGLTTAKLVGDFLGPIARPIIIALTASPEQLIGREHGTKSAFDLVMDKASDLSLLVSAIANCLKFTPNAAVKQAAKDIIQEQAENRYFNGNERLRAQGDGPGEIRILVVEDDEIQRLILLRAFRKLGYVVDMVSDGLEAIRKLRDSCFDLAILDYNLPEIDGVALATLIHDQMAEAWRPRLIGLTVAPDVLNVKVAITGPVFDEVLDKACGIGSLISAVNRLLKHSPNPDTRRAATAILTTDG